MTQWRLSDIEDAIWNGTSFLAVDCSIDGGSPYMYHLSADKILGFKLDEDDVFTEIRIAETAIVPDGDWGEKEVERVRVFQRVGEVVTWSLWENGSGGYTQVVANQAFALKSSRSSPFTPRRWCPVGSCLCHLW